MTMNQLSIRTTTRVAFLLSTLAVIILGPVAAAQTTRRDRQLMHTTVTIAVADRRPTQLLDAAFADAFAVFETIDGMMNEWKPDSELARMNAAAGGEAVTVSAPLCTVLRLALDGARRTDGLFDPTWAALRDVWRFGDDEPKSVPTPEAIEAACRRIDHQSVEMAELPNANGGCSVRLARAGMKLGLGGVAKGWGVDQAVKRLRQRGLRNFWVQAGGDLFFSGRNGTRAWVAGIRDPRGAADESFATLEVTNRAVSTSGDYEHFFVVDDVRYHHIIDPRTCRPATASRSATVVARSATDAEFLSKAVFILGGVRGIELADRWGASAVVVEANNQLFVSQQLSGPIRVRPPTK